MKIRNTSFYSLKKQNSVGIQFIFNECIEQRREWRQGVKKRKREEGKGGEGRKEEGRGGEEKRMEEGRCGREENWRKKPIKGCLLNSDK